MRCGYCSDNAIDCGQKERREVPIRRRPVASPSASSTRGSSSSSQPRVDLVCPYREKDEAKKLGARWDPGAKTWFVPPGKPLAPFTKWLPVSQGVGAAEVVPASAQGGAAPSQITCGDLWKDLQFLSRSPAEFSEDEYYLSSSADECYLKRIVIEGDVVVVEAAASVPRPPFYACGATGSDETGDGSVRRPVKTAERAEEIAVDYRRPLSWDLDHWAMKLRTWIVVRCSEPS